ncbi:hypothetical protein X777_08707 [Ooceraea biroi]|uniref:Uncharacterized protein n=1 Tax=Ooceraea biroi TaxID=2015173 RepID=A0A026WAZ7_OOCBI|nr:hypothetical protein X777_08707 [Ooceraea biroi]
MAGVRYGRRPSPSRLRVSWGLLSPLEVVPVTKNNSANSNLCGMLCLPALVQR